ncbi:hypothetical protein TREMEDRAFT_33681 [Tremella mesenterica DSM 1558]|uniref:uncharacterized protein n=1 Tax=Tremella mesenterica (strain ATCC 24925 / CBS 8224 / DSM 1558 / NBRC 9311 / NRRL Y-6157 / RJB 2259-6 / UBC 559-6) TaxID=578456 RepID=UPI0003F4A4CC|nr:uncharacterized protein TREMEDRAFT_33681 [Tremella mesenterica DSM 1558]EIW67384.1 hypothetical protein TREMEDRAFT_33681 [Tremella mesenterica DSM 1558]
MFRDEAIVLQLRRLSPLTNRKREARHHDEDDRDRSRRHRHREERERERDRDRPEEEDRERRHRRHRERDNETEEERKERHERRRREREEETEEERAERHRRRREKDLEHRERYRNGNGHSRGPESEGRDRRESREIRDDRYRSRDRSRESYRSHRSRDLREMTREEKEAEREKRDREMAEEKREAARLKEERFAQRERRTRERDFSPRRRRPSPTYEIPRPRDSPPPTKEKDPVSELLEEVDSEARSVFVSQISSRMTSSDLGLFFEDKLGRGAVRDARVVTDRGSKRSKGIGYVELDAVALVNRALALSGTIVMGMPIQVTLTESERNREGMDLAATIAKLSASKARPQVTYQTRFPPLSNGLYIPPGVDVDANRDASVPYHRLFVSGLAYSLAADDIKQVFDPFGQIDFVDLHHDVTGQSKGTAYVQFHDLKSAQTALDAMNGFEIAGRPIRVQTIQERAHISETLEDAGYSQGRKMDNSTRMSLMQKLARNDGPGSAHNSPLQFSCHKMHIIDNSTNNAPVAPTPFILVNNMFNPEEETERNWDLDLAEDVKGEIESKYGRVKRIKVDKMSAGDVYVEFEGTGASERAVKGLHGRFFGGRSLRAGYISEGLFKLHL